MAFRERIEAVLRVKDAGRFKATLKGAAKAVRELGEESDKTAAEMEVLHSIDRKMERQLTALSALLEITQSRMNEMGDEAIAAAAKMQIMNLAAKKSGSNAVFLGKSWAFWKDRLSLTRSEMLTTALTIGAYLSPALIALGSSATAALLGGAAVGAGGIAALGFGILTMGIIAKQTTGHIQKITKAQDAYTLAVEQYGANSKQASRASAHMYAVIKTQGGKPMLDAANNIRKLKDSWNTFTGGARTNVAGILSGGAGSLTKLMPTIGAQTNLMSKALKDSLTGKKGAFAQLSGGEMQANLKVLGSTFQHAIGPGVKGATNAIIALFRILRAAAPWVVKWAQAWERTTMSWRKGTKDSMKVQRTVDSFVRQFKAWWGLAKEIGRTFKIVFGATKDDGGRLVITLTHLVDRFNDWLQALKDSGKLKSAFQTYLDSLHEVVWAIQHPVEAIKKWLPVVMDAIATTMATHAPRAAELFITAFMNSGSWAQLLTVAYFAKKFGFFGALGRRTAGPFARSFIAALLPRFAAASAAGGALEGAFVSAGTASGAAFGAAFIAAAGPLIVVWAAHELNKYIDSKVTTPDELNLHQGGRDEGGGIKGWLKRHVRENPLDTAKTFHPFGWGKGKAVGGTIPFGGASIVGESGPEVAHTGALGTTITPLSRAKTGRIGSLDTPNLSGMIHVHVNTSIQINRREIAKAVGDEIAFTKARRGGS